MKIIDSHIHIVKYINGFGSQGELYTLGDGEVMYASGKKFRIIPKGMGEYGFTPEKAIDIMNEYGVEKGVLLQGNYLGFQNLYSYEASKKYPDRFISAGTLDPFCVNKEKIKKYLFDELGLKIIKMEVSNGSGLMCNHDKVLLDSEIMEDLYQMASEKDITFVIDIGRPRNNCFQPDRLLKMVKKYNNVTFVICHLFACQLGDDELLIKLLNDFNLPNVYFDLASVNNNTKPEIYPYNTAIKYIRYACDIVGSSKLMWGSDMPSGICNDSYENNIKYIMNSNCFSKQEKENIFYNTANNVYFKNQ